jgi:poly(A) polymerase
VEVGVEIARQILTRLRFSNEDMRQVEALVANHMKFKDAPRMKESTLKRFLRLPAFDEHLELHRLDCSSSHNMLDNYHFVQEKRTQFGQEQIAPPPMLTGKDLIAAGYKPGPWFSRVLSAVEDAQLEGRISNKGQALALAASMSERASEPAST